jgi:hypothetical protein
MTTKSLTEVPRVTHVTRPGNPFVMSNKRESMPSGRHAPTSPRDTVRTRSLDPPGAAVGAKDHMRFESRAPGRQSGARNTANPRRETAPKSIKALDSKHFFWNRETAEKVEPALPNDVGNSQRGVGISRQRVEAER